jgi:selenide,water dikinase
VSEAGAVVVGGHTVEDDEPKYGLAVTGLVHPDRVVTNAGARPGDRLVLTKRLGTGLMSDAYMDGEIDEAALQPAIDSMVQLNKTASEAMVEQEAHACTDVTGFGLLGHARELAAASEVGLRFQASQVLALDLAREIAENRQGGGLRRNRLTFEKHTRFGDAVPEATRRLLFDPQTSGGLLIALSPEREGPLLEALIARGVEATGVGEAVPGPPGEIAVEG